MIGGEIYARMHFIAFQCGGLAIEGRLLSHNLTQEVSD